MYKHTQIAWVILITFGLGMVILLYAGVQVWLHAPPRGAEWIVPFGVLLLLGVTAVLFHSLTVIVDNEFIHVRFGPGLIKFQFRLTDVEACRPVRNRWWYGWGIRWLGKGWLFNVSGLDAVEMSMKNGKVYRIGTDEPQKLSEFIQEKLNK